jgi:hypothetical protein
MVSSTSISPSVACRRPFRVLPKWCQSDSGSAWLTTAGRSRNSGIGKFGSLFGQAWLAPAPRITMRGIHDHINSIVGCVIESKVLTCSGSSSKEWTHPRSRNADLVSRCVRVGNGLDTRAKRRL